MARKRGIEAIVDGAHAFAHFPFAHADLDCDYYATSLHKWLLAPHGTGFLYVRKPKIPKIWPLMAAPEKMDADVRKFEEIGTHPAANHNAIAEALELRLKNLDLVDRVTRANEHLRTEVARRERAEASRSRRKIACRGEDFPPDRPAPAGLDKRRSPRFPPGGPSTGAGDADSPCPSGNIRAAEAHGDADVSRPQRRPVVDPVSGHRDHAPRVL